VHGRLPGSAASLGQVQGWFFAWCWPGLSCLCHGGLSAALGEEVGTLTVPVPPAHVHRCSAKPFDSHHAELQVRLERWF
jgi:hypothetical protein